MVIFYVVTSYIPKFVFFLDKHSDYCLDYTINYCNGAAIPTLKPIINDENLRLDVASTIYGTNKEDSSSSKLLKQIGYPISIAFLVLTLLFFIIDEDLTKVYKESLN